MNQFRFNNQLSLINEEEDEDLNLTERMAKFQTSPDVKQNGLEKQSSNSSKSTGLDRFMTFLDQPQSNSNKKLKPLPSSKKVTVIDELNPQNTARPRPRSSLQRNTLTKFTQFLQSQDLAIQQKQKAKKVKRANGLNKFMETLCVAEEIKQQKKLSNIVSGILALSQNLPQVSVGKQKYRYLINSQKFANIRPKGKQTKVRSHSANLMARRSKEAKKYIGEQQTLVKSIKRDIIKHQTLCKEQISEKAFERKVKFFENIGESKSLFLKHPSSTQNKDNFAFLN